MTVILSRKGFDSENGGIASPILNDRLISLPIRTTGKGVELSKLHDSVNQVSYLSLVQDLQSGYRDHSCHLDPDIYDGIIAREPGWRGLFGQCGAAQWHLDKSRGEQSVKIKVGDLFIFFGWFKKAVESGGKFRFVPDAPDWHVIYGYLQVGEIWGPAQLECGDVPAWARCHPHVKPEGNDNKPNNTVYVAREKLSFEPRLPGWGVFNFHENLVLTKTGETRSKWKLLDAFINSKLSYHSSASINKTDGYFQSARRGQEFIFYEGTSAQAWAESIIKEHSPRSVSE